VVIIGDRHMRQRCGWCGETLLEYDLARVAVPIGTDPMPASWPVGSQVTVDGNAQVATGNVDRLYDDACARNPLTFASFG
jgi:hypothetical protein